MKKYLRIYKRFLENAVSYQSVYRKDTWIEVIVLTVWVGMLFLVIDVLFQYTDAIAGWTKQDMYLMSLFWTISYELSTLVYRRSIQKLPDVITDGDLDLLLIKPVNEIFLSTLQKVEVRSIFTLLIQFGLVGWITWQYDFAVSFWHILFAVFLLLCSVAIQYSMSLMANTLSFWLLRISNINDAMWALRGVGKYPLDIYPATGKILLLTFLPVGFMAYGPLYALTTVNPWFMLLLGVSVTTLFFIASVSFWNYAVRNYTSASS